MKYTLTYRIADFEKVDVDIEGTSEDVVLAYKELKSAFKEGEGLPAKEWTAFLDTYVSTGKPPDGGLELWERMDTRQRDIINECKKTFKRLAK